MNKLGSFPIMVPATFAESADKRKKERKNHSPNVSSMDKVARSTQGIRPCPPEHFPGHPFPKTDQVTRFQYRIPNVHYARYKGRDKHQIIIPKLLPRPCTPLRP